ncbi:MAG: alpha/beta hydrolase, partial [Gemmatimonadota bacterium]|nr:alpha/beta hydrolase [Gemmatimonadota bacterium]
ALARVLAAVDDAANGAVLVAHSMGTRVAMDALFADSANAARFATRPLRALGIFSPDIGADRFRAEFAPRLPMIAHRVALYGASTDYLLGASAMLNRERRAAGITRRGAALHGIELVDATRGARAEPALLTWLGPRHAVRWASAALADFFSIVVADAPPACRVTVGTADTEGDGRWRLRRRTMPGGWLSANCEAEREAAPR